MMKKISFEDALILRGVKTARALVRRLPPRAAMGVARLIGWILYAGSKRRKITYRNVRAAFAAELPRARMKWIARESMLGLTGAVIELLRAPELTRKSVDAHMRLIGAEKFEPTLAKGRGVIFLAAHFGNWELLSIVAGIYGYPILALARTQKHPRSDDYLTALRSSHGAQVVRKGMPIREIVRGLKEGKIVGILGDQDAGKTGTFVRFFGRLSSAAPGPATFALRTHSEIYPAFCFREPGARHRIEVEGPLRVPDASLSPADAERDLLQQFADMLEAKIRRAPEQWLWAHRRWKSSPDRFVVILSDGKSGHLNQSLAVAGAIRAEREATGAPPECFHQKTVEIRYRNAFARSALATVSFLTAGRLPFKYFLLKAALTPESYAEAMKSYADIVISCGSSLLPVNLTLKAENACRSVAVMRPYFGARLFDAVIVPRHDKMKPAKNVFVTDCAPSVVTDALMREEGARLIGDLGLHAGSRRIGVLVGGDTAEMKFSRGLLSDALDALLRLSSEPGTQILATSSRRTPRWADELLKETLSDRVRCPLLVIANEANRPGVVSAILGASDVLIVSGESMSMVSEAVSSGKPVVVFMPSDDMRFKAKYRDFLDRMSRERLIVTAGPKGLYQAVRQVASGPGSLSRRSGDAEVLNRAAKRVA